MKSNVAACIDCCRLATDLADFAQDADGLVGELLEVLGIDARRCFGHVGSSLVAGELRRQRSLMTD